MWKTFSCSWLLALESRTSSGLVKCRSFVTRSSLLSERCRMTSSSSSNTKNISDEWSPLNPESLVAAPCLIEQTLCQANTDEQQPQLAASVEYATAVLDAWKQQEADDADTTAWNAEWKAVTYQDSKGIPLYGHVVRNPSNAESTHSASLPPSAGILLFHTGAGPHDLFLLWKAAALVNSNLNGNSVVVLIADVLSDETGWAWNPDDRTKYDTAREYLFQKNDRANLRDRVCAAVKCLKQQQGIDKHNSKLVALGWCLGGHAIAELGRLRLTEISAMVTFHGVFAGLIVDTDDNDHTEESAASPIASEILICHGIQDPFVPATDLENALALFQRNGHTVSLLQLENAKHGFTNPAQEFNDNPAFGFDQEAADKAWRQTIALLRRRIGTANDR